MKELRQMINAYVATDFSKKKAALATVVKVRESAYRRPGARMFITDDGKWTGAVSGGCLEGDALRKAREVINTGVSKIVTYDTMADENAMKLGIGLGCNGIIDILFEPVGDRNATFDIFKKIVERDKPVFINTILDSTNKEIHPGSKCVKIDYQLLETSNFPQTLKPALLEEIAGSKRSTSFIKKLEVDSAAYEVLFERIDPDIKLIIFGGGHDVPPVIDIAKILHWDVTVTDDCVAHLLPVKFPKADKLIAVPKDLVAQQLRFDNYTAALLMSHNFKYDLEVLKNIIRLDIPYIGILGPRKRFEKIQQKLVELGFSRNLLDRVHSPVGLDLGSETADEIALSIISEIQAVFRKKSGGKLVEKGGVIHQRTGIENLSF